MNGLNIDLMNNLKQYPELWEAFVNENERFDTESKCDESNRAKALIPAISEFLLKQGYQVGYPGNKKFALCLTHDVDDIYPPLTHRVLSGLYSLKKFDWYGLKKHVFCSKQTSPYINFQKIMDLEKKYHAKSTFYFWTADSDPRRFRYHIEDIASKVKFIANNGWEVGLHGGFYSYNDIAAVKREKSRLENVLGREVIGYRNHYLRFQTPGTWDILEQCGFKYDSTYGYTNAIGFRNGMCHPFRPYHPIRQKWINIYELPLNVMECAMFDYVSPRDAWARIRSLLEKAESNQGILTVLWHNNTLDCPFREAWGALYEKILQYGSEHHAWMTSGEELWRWWVQNGY